MPAEVQPLLLTDQPVRWGDFQTCEITYNESLAFFDLEKKGMIRVITVWVDDHGYRVKFMERK